MSPLFFTQKQSALWFLHPRPEPLLSVPFVVALWQGGEMTKLT